MFIIFIRRVFYYIGPDKFRRHKYHRDLTFTGFTGGDHLTFFVDIIQVCHLVVSYSYHLTDVDMRRYNYLEDLDYDSFSSVFVFVCMTFQDKYIS